jgi:hypothetical protein
MVVFREPPSLTISMGSQWCPLFGKEPRGYWRSWSSRPVSRVLYSDIARAVIIYLALKLPSGSSDQPEDRPGTCSPSIRSCSKWGLPCLRCHHQSGELLPRLFTLTSSIRGGMFLWHFPSQAACAARAWVLPSILPGGARTFLSPRELP